MAEPARGKSPRERHVQLEAAPNPLAELLARPSKNSQEISAEVPNIEGRQRNRMAEIPAAPVVSDD